MTQLEPKALQPVRVDRDQLFKSELFSSKHAENPILVLPFTLKRPSKLNTVSSHDSGSATDGSALASTCSPLLGVYTSIDIFREYKVVSDIGGSDICNLGGRGAHSRLYRRCSPPFCDAEKAGLGIQVSTEWLGHSVSASQHGVLCPRSRS